MENTNDPTEEARKALIPEMPSDLIGRVEQGEQYWSAQEVGQDFEILNFIAPFAYARRKSDNVKGTLMFTHMPRYYFGFEPE